MQSRGLVKNITAAALLTATVGLSGPVAVAEELDREIRQEGRQEGRQELRQERRQFDRRH